MRKSIFLMIMLTGMLNLKSQDYNISFAGNGASNNVDSVRVENLTQATNLKLAGDDILHLVQSVGIKDVNAGNLNSLKVYPNPFADYCNIEFDAAKPSSAIIELFDITGNQVIHFEENLLQGRHIYRISGLKSGIYFLRIHSDLFSYTAKLLSNSYHNEALNISISEQLLNSSKQDQNKSFNKNAASKQKGTSVDMQYNTGDMLKITGFSGVYATVVMLIPAQSQAVSFAFVPCTDADGNNYSIVEIGNEKSAKGKQVWMTENLKTSKYANGDDIANVTDDALWNQLSTGAFCWNNNDNMNEKTYGKLYNFHAAFDGRKICPAGWHVPAESEWAVLISYLGGENVAGGKLKETGTIHWTTPNTGATNESGFTALPGGDRENSFNGETGSGCFFWSSTQYSSEYAYGLYVSFNSPEIGGYNDYYKTYGFSVRCLLGEALYAPVLNTDSVTGVTSTSAISGGNVLSDGGATVTSRGICWDTIPNPTINDSITIDGDGTGSFISNISGLKLNTKYYVRAYATNSVGTAYGKEYSFTTTYAIGETFEGGKIAYILQPGDPGYIEGETHGLIAASEDQSTGAPWGCYGTLISGTSTAIGTGKANTDAIINSCGEAGIAARLCADLDIDGYNDWYLPSTEEFNKLVQNRGSIGGLAGYEYWSSTEGGTTYAWTVGSTFGDLSSTDKDNLRYVRAVRSF